MRKYVTEFIGTFFLVLTISLAVPGGSDLAPLAIGASLMVMIFMGGHISGAHYNPAVSLAVLIRGKLPAKDFVPYVAAQLLGGVAAVLAAVACGVVAPVIAPAVAPGSALLVEVLYTLALALVVLNVATAKETANNSFYGLAIGFTVAAGAVAGGRLSGGAFNPAVGTALTLSQWFNPKPAGVTAAADFSHLWIYWVGPLVGGALAAAVFLFQHPRDPAETPGGTAEAPKGRAA